MKALLKKTSRLIIAVSIPVLFLASCENDLIEPENAMPPKKDIKLPPGAVKY
jgi:hypothetical protein